MVALKEVKDEVESLDLDYISDAEEYEDEEEVESLLQRLAGLSDAIPLKSRLAVSSFFEDAFTFTLGMGQVVGNVAWVVVTGAMVLVLPAALELEKVGLSA